MALSEKNTTSNVVSKIVDSLQDRFSEIRIEDVRIGLGYTAVLLEDNRVGLAYTFREETRGGCSVFQALSPILGRPASVLLNLLKSTDPIEAAVGLACANAFTNQNREEFQAGDILGHLDLRPGDHVGMVGRFEPLVKVLKEQARLLTVFERIDEPQGYLRPISEIEDLLPQCQVALITATSIINHTVDTLLGAAKRCRTIVVLGASTPMLPEAFLESNVSMLSGVVVEEPIEVLRVVSEGGGMRFFKPYVRKANLIL